MLSQGALYHCHTPPGKLEEVLWFVVPMAHLIAAWMDVTEILDTRVSRKCCASYMTSSGGQEWPLRCRRWSATVSDASSMNAFVLKLQCNPSLLLHLWSCYMLTLPALRQQQSWWTFWSFMTTLKNMLWHMWPLTKLQKLLLSFCGKDTSRSSEHQPSSWMTEGPTLKATSSESFATLWAYGRFRLHHTMLRPKDR